MTEETRIFDVVWKRAEAEEGKAIWVKVDILVLKSDGRMYLKLDLLPVGPSFDGWFFVFERLKAEDFEVPF